MYSFNFFCNSFLSINFRLYSETIVGDKLRLRANSTTSSSLLAQRITPTLGFSCFAVTNCDRKHFSFHICGTSANIFFQTTLLPLRILFQFQHVFIEVRHKQPILNNTIFFKFSFSFCFSNLGSDFTCILKNLSVISHQK